MINKKPLIKFIIWFGMMILISIVGIINVKADTYSASQFDANLYDNYGPTLHYVTTDFTNNRWQGTIPTMTANSSGAAWGISSPVVLLSGHTYSLSAQISGPFGGNIRLSTYNRIGVGTSFANSVISYQNNSYVTENYSNVSYNILQFAFTPTTNGNYIVFPFATTYTGNNQTFWLENIIIDDLGASGGVSESTINNSLNNQTNILNNSITASTNTITENSNNNKQAIIDNQNANNEALIENDNANTDKIIESNKVCSKIDKVNIEIDNKLLYYVDGSIRNDNAYGITSYFKLNDSSMLKLITPYSNQNIGICFYTINKELLNCTQISSISANTEITIPSGASYFRSTIRKNVNAPTYELCSNGNSALNDSVNSLNDSLTDSSSIDISGIGNTTGWLPPGPIDSIINLPLTFLNNMLNALNRTCSPLSVPLPYVNKTVSIPCISTIFSKITGLPSFWNWVGIITSVMILYKYLLALYKYYDDLTTLKANFISDFGGAP